MSISKFLPIYENADVEVTLGQPDKHKIAMANPTPVEMTDIATGEAEEREQSAPAPCSKEHQTEQKLTENTEIPRSWPNEVFVFKIKETLPEGCQATSPCTRESCSCDQEMVSQLVTKFCEGLRDVATSRSQMCPHTVADVLKGELNGVFFTWLEGVNDCKYGPVPSPPPSSCQESSPTSETTTTDRLLISTQSPSPDGPEKDTRVHAQLYLNSAIYDSLNGSSGMNKGYSGPDELQILPVIESQVDKRNSGIDEAPSSPMGSNIIIENVSSVRVENEPNPIPDDSPTLETTNCNGMEVDEEDLRSKQNANQYETSESQPILEIIHGLGDDDIAEGARCSANKQSSSSTDKDKHCQVGVPRLERDIIPPSPSACKNTKGTSDGVPSRHSTRRSSTQNGNETTQGVGASSDIQTGGKEQGKLNETENRKLESNRKSLRVEIKQAWQNAAPASVKQKRRDQIQARLQRASKQQPSPSPGGSESDSPLKRKHAGGDEFLSSSPEMSMAPKKGRLPLLESEDEYDDVSGRKDVPMDVDYNEKDGKQQIAVDDSQSVLPGPYLVVPYASSEVSESETSQPSPDNVPVVQPLRLQNASFAEGTHPKNNTPGQMLNKSKRANEMGSSLHEEKRVTDQEGNSDVTDDIEVIAKLPHVPGTSMGNGNEKDKHIHMDLKSKSLRKRTSTPVESQTDSNLDSSTTSKKTPPLRKWSGNLKKPGYSDTCGQEELLGKDYNRMRSDSETRKAPETPMIETTQGNDNTAATKSKSSSRPPAPPPPIISWRRVPPPGSTNRDLAGRETGQQRKGPPIIPSPTVMLQKKMQQNLSSQQRFQPSRPHPTPGNEVRLDGGEFRMAPSSTSAVRPSTVPSYRDRDMGDAVRNSAGDNIPLEYRYIGSYDY